MTTTEDANVSCSLGQADLQRRGQEVRQGIGRRVLETRELEDGLVYRFAPEDEKELREFVAFERGCCSFAEFTIREADAGTALWLEIRGPEGTKQLFRGLKGEVAPTHGNARSDGFLRLGLGGGASAALALVCCATPALPFVLGVLGLVSATSAIGFWVDALALPALGICAAIVGWRLWARLRPAPQADCDC